MNTINLQHILFIDIETVPEVYKYNELDTVKQELWDARWRYKSDINPEQQYAKSGIYAEFAKVICIGLGFYDGKNFRVKAISGENESDILKQFSELVGKHFNAKEHLLCAHNGKEFDYPFLCRRFIINDIPLPKILQLQGLKPWEVQHLDTMELWKFGDMKNFTSLNLLANVLQIPSPKEDMDGSQVSRVFYEEKNLSKIMNYCLKDVITLARVFQRFMGLGNLPDEQVIYA
jgi:3'-5' exonuclease